MLWINRHFKTPCRNFEGRNKRTFEGCHGTWRHSVGYPELHNFENFVVKYLIWWHLTQQAHKLSIWLHKIFLNSQQFIVPDNCCINCHPFWNIPRSFMNISSRSMLQEISIFNSGVLHHNHIKYYVLSYTIHKKLHIL